MRINLFLLLAFTPVLLLSELNTDREIHPLISTDVSKGMVIEDFEDGVVILTSYSDEDIEPSAWELESSNTYDSSNYALRLYGNTWKLEEIEPCSLKLGDVWRVAAYIEEQAEIQGFGLVDSSNVLLYAFGGTHLLNPDYWITVYQGAFSQAEWHTYLLPVAQDWEDWYGYIPVITGLVYLNDRDYIDQGITIFDEIYNITEDLPIPPEVEIQYTSGRPERNSKNKLVVNVQFYAIVFDPDSDTFNFYWDFGDGDTSTLENPSHEFVVLDDHSYTVRLEVVDTDGMWGRDTCRIDVDPGLTTFPLTINFVGDIMLARRYEQPGGIIPTYGVEYIFEPTLGIYGEAAEISVCNLENPLTDEGEPHPTKPIIFRSSPENVAGLVYAGIDVVSLANNHIIDYGIRGMEETQEVLETEGILFSGAGINSYFALQPVFLSKDGVNIAFISLCNRTGQYDNYQPFLNAGYNKPGFGYLTEHNLGRCIGYAKELADLVVVQFHSGIEYNTTPPIRLDGLNPWDPDVIRFPTKPSMNDMELRWEAIDLGADVVINHHPHVLQGFEVYNGKLIAHSLGDFTFDLTYPETYPSVVLQSSIDSDGFHSFYLTPVFIDDYIPRPATGELGCHILERLADYSRELGTLVSVVPDSITAHIILDTTSVETEITLTKDSTELEEIDAYWVSEAIALFGNGSLSSVTSIIGGSTQDIRIGREVLWFGNFEDEGATMWNLNSSDEWFEDTLAHSGKRCLCLRRYNTSGDNVITDLEGRLPCESDKAYTLTGWIKTDSTNDATIQIRFYRYRYSGVHLSQEDVGTLVDGNTDWTFYQKELVVPSLASYFNVRCNNDIPDNSVSHAWFDDVKVIEWQDWEPADLPFNVPYPNNFRFLQIRSASFADSVFVEYKETNFNKIQTQVEQHNTETLTSFFLYQNYPNPFNSTTTIYYLISSKKGQLTPVSLKIYNILGQKVATLVDDVQNAGHKTVHWDASGFASGIYFFCLESGDFRITRKMLLLH